MSDLYPDKVESPLERDARFMQHAFTLAEHAASIGEVPVGAVVVNNTGDMIGKGYNRTLTDVDPSAHAEIVALRHAARQQDNHRMPGVTLYCTLEPCCMCAGAIIQARVSRVVFAATDPRSGAVASLFELLDDDRLNHRCPVEGGVLAEQSTTLLRRFFAERRK